MKTALSIAGSDSSGGAGIQADLKTMTMNGVYAMTAITALTAQNTTGVTGIQEVTPQFLQLQIDAVFEDIRPDAVKIVVDFVMVATSGARLVQRAKDYISEALSAMLDLGQGSGPMNHFFDLTGEFSKEA